jgi:hypothetical protein
MLDGDPDTVSDPEDEVWDDFAKEFYSCGQTKPTNDL